MTGSAILRRARRFSRRYYLYVVRRPALLIVLFPVYLVLAGACSLAFAQLCIWATGKPPVTGLSVIPLGALYFVTPLILVPFLGHYLWFNLSVFRRHVLSNLHVQLVGRLLQVLVSVVFVFASVYYFMQLFSDGTAFHGMSTVHSPVKYEPSHEHVVDLLYERLQLVPTPEALVDCLYFSVVAITTVGFGDMYPLTWWAKLATAAELITGFIIVALALGSVVGQQARQRNGKATGTSA